jgi:hypothetical protein
MLYHEVHVELLCNIKIGYELKPEGREFESRLGY